VGSLVGNSLCTCIVVDCDIYDEDKTTPTLWLSALYVLQAVNVAIGKHSTWQGIRKIGDRCEIDLTIALEELSLLA